VGNRGPVSPELAKLRDLGRLLRLTAERRKSEADSENDREPGPPHGTSVEDGWRESSRPARS
jgi:hypothetical protein